MGKTYKYNPLTDQMDIVQDSSVIILKNVVDSAGNLPLTGNTENDLYIVRDTDSLYTWNSTNSSGTIIDWVSIGAIAGVDWSGILNGPSSSPANIDNAVITAHVKNKDTKLDEGGVNEKSAATLIESIPIGNAKQVTDITFDPVTNKITVLYENS